MVSPQIPKHDENIIVQIPEAHILQVTFNRPDKLNAMNTHMVASLTNILAWFDDEPELWCLVITGKGRAFSAGADLTSWRNDQESGSRSEQEQVATSAHGFGALSRRNVSSKPIIAAVNGLAFGGGLEIIMNCDIVIASEDAKLGFPEVARGVTAAQGAMPRVAAISGHQLASELLLLGRTITAKEAQERFRFVNQVVAPSSVLPTAIDWARQIVTNSPEAVASTKRALLLAKHYAGIEQSTIASAWSPESKRVYRGENIKEGLRAFAERRKPVWKNPARL